MSPADRVCRPGAARSSGLSLALGLCLLAGSASGASLPEGGGPGPRLVSPPPDAVVSESGVRFAWSPPPGAARHLLLLSPRPFDSRGWSRVPADPAIQVHELRHPVASLEQLGVGLEADTRLYWASAGEDRRSGRLWFSEVRSCFVLRKFSNRVEPSPYLGVSSVERVSPSPRQEPDRIRLRAGYVIDPRVGEPPIASGLRESAGAGGWTFLVYYGDADPEKLRDDMLASGATIVASVPDRAFLVRTRGEIASSAAGAAAWIGVYQPAYKLSRRLELDSTLPRTASVLVFADGDLAGVARAVEAQGGSVIVSSSNGINKLLRISATGAQLAALAHHPDVAWIEPHVPPTTDNSSAQWVVQTHSLNNRRVWSMGIQGEGQVVMTSDTGVDMTHNQFRDTSLAVTTFGDYPTHRKVIAYKLGSSNAAVTFGDHTGASYHGTHTACTAVGTDDGISSSSNDGMAKYGKLYFMDISGPTLGNTVDPFPDLNDLFLPSYLGNAGGAARISSNSWGAPVAGEYDIMSLGVDQFMWNHPDYLIFFSNGNSGPGPGTVGSPATAKDAVGVGGVRNGAADTLIYSATSRGPCQDGRLKPTLCAPASSLTSAYLGPSQYQGLSGTSMASPSMAGAAALMRQYCTEGWYPTGSKVPANGFAPSAALLKAMCVNSGDNGVSGFTAPDFNIGFGRIDADSVLYFAGDQRRLLLVDFTQGLGNLQAIEYQVNVTDGAIPLEVSLCWTDYPGDPAVLTQLVNNLDLVVTNGVVSYKGNAYLAGFSTTGGTADNRNVEEGVRVRTPAPGLWTIRVTGAAVPLGPQPFGLCITGGIGTSAGALALDRASYGSASTVQLRVTDTNAGGSVAVTLTSPTEPGGETVTLAGSSGVYTGSIALSPFAGAGGDGILQVSHGDLITATYDDASPVATLSASAGVSFDAPLITAVSASSQGNGGALVTWTTDRNASSRVYYGPGAVPDQASAFDPTAALNHQVLIPGLAVGQTYTYDVESQDLEGNLTRDDNGGAHYRFTVNPPADLLLVYGGPDFERSERYAAALGALGWDHDLWKGPLSEDPELGDPSSGLRSYKAVWWQVGLDYYPPLTDPSRDALTQYLDGGGRLAVTGHDIGWALVDPASPFRTTERASWVQNTLHTIYNADPPGWVGVTGLAGDPISGAYAGGIAYAEHRFGASGDEIDSFPGDGTAAYCWRSAETTPDDCAIRWESNGPRGTPGTAYWGGAPSRLVAMYFEWSGVDPDNDPSPVRVDIMHQTLKWLLGRDKPAVTVSTPNGGSTITGNSAPIAWAEATSGGASPALRSIDYSPDGGDSWIPITASAGPSPYVWDLTSVPNTSRARIRVRVTDDGSPSFTGSDASDAPFAVQRPGGDAAGPAVVAGSIRVNPNPVNNQQPATLTATLSDELSGGGIVAAAEWSFGDIPALAGQGHPMAGAFDASTVAANATLATGGFALGQHGLWVRGRDQAGNWGAARSLSVVVNGVPPVGVAGGPHALELFQNAPNPVLESTVISFATPSGGPVRLVVYDAQGRQVRALLDGNAAAGAHRVAWNRADDAGRRVAPGLYYYRLTAAGCSLQRRAVALR